MPQVRYERNITGEPGVNRFQPVNPLLRRFQGHPRYSSNMRFMISISSCWEEIDLIAERLDIRIGDRRFLTYQDGTRMVRNHCAKKQIIPHEHLLTTHPERGDEKHHKADC